MIRATVAKRRALRAERRTIFCEAMQESPGGQIVAPTLVQCVLTATWAAVLMFQTRSTGGAAPAVAGEGMRRPRWRLRRRVVRDGRGGTARIHLAPKKGSSEGFAAPRKRARARVRAGARRGCRIVSPRRGWRCRCDAGGNAQALPARARVEVVRFCPDGPTFPRLPERCGCGPGVATGAAAGAAARPTLAARHCALATSRDPPNPPRGPGASDYAFCPSVARHLGGMEDAP